jgi:DNA-binding SARP family transcriptional activator
MDFRILGPVQVFSGGRQVRLSGERQCALLAYLLLHAREVVSADRLLDELWLEPPRGGLAALQSQISRLRKLVGDRIVTTGSGYAIRLEPGELDLERFRTLLSEARASADAADRARLLRAADALWRGVPLAGLDVPFAAADVSALEELRLAALEDRLEADLELGRNGELVSELSALVARYPLRERLRSHLILALYRSGRQADALEAYRDTRRMLDEELGLEPSPALRELERAILCHDPALAGVERRRPPLGAARRSRRGALLGAAAAALGLGVGAGAAVDLAGGGHARQAAAVQAPRVVTEPLVGIAHGDAARPRSHTNARVVRLSVAWRPHVRPTTRPAPPAAPRPTPTRRPATTAKKTAPATTPTRLRVATATTPPKKPATTTSSGGGPPPAQPVTISDDFAGAQVDPTIWYQIATGRGWTLAQHDGQVEYTFTPDAVPGGDYDVFGGHLGLRCTFPGDFDARVDYSLPQWPHANGVTASLWAFFSNDGWAVSRKSAPRSGELYVGATGPDASSGVPLDDRSGTFRLVRSAGVVKTYFLRQGNWELLSSAPNTALATIAIGAYGSSTDGFDGQPVVVDFGNFTVTGLDPICPPAG